MRSGLPEQIQNMDISKQFKKRVIGNEWKVLDTSINKEKISVTRSYTSSLLHISAHFSWFGPLMRWNHSIEFKKAYKNMPTPLSAY